MEERVDYSRVIDYVDTYQGDFDQEMLLIFRDLAKKAEDNQKLIDQLRYLTDKKRNEGATPKILEGIESGNFVRGTITETPDGRYMMPFYQAALENSDKVLFIFDYKDNVRGKVGDKVEFYTTRKTDDGHLIFGRVVQKTA